MVADNFQRALKLVLVDEGGLDDDPHDHGGRTAYGIIQREYDGYRARHKLPPQDVWKITPAEYTEIYKDRYWSPWCDRLPSGLDYVFFDACVNVGPAQAAKSLQKALGVRIDGFMGDVTLGAAQSDDRSEAIKAFCDARRAFYRALAQFPRYGRGWLNRVQHVQNAALAMVVDPDQAQRNGFDDDLKSQASARARAEDVAQAPVSTPTAATGTATTAIGAGYAEQLGTFADKLSPLQDAISVVKYLLLGITLIGLGFTVYSIWHDKQIKAATG